MTELFIDKYYYFYGKYIISLQRLKMKRENNFHSLCFFERCVRQNKGIFDSSEEQYHFTDHIDKVHPIHFKTISNIFGSHSTSQQIKFKEQCNNINELLRNHLQKNNMKILEYLTKKIINPATRQFMEYAEKCKNGTQENLLTPQNILNRLKNCDLELFENLYQYQKNEKNLFFTEVMVLKKLKQRLNLILLDLDDKTNNIILGLQLILKNYGDLKIAMAHVQFSEGINDLKKDVSYVFKKNQNQANPLLFQKQQFHHPNDPQHQPQHQFTIQQSQLKQQYIQSRNQSSQQEESYEKFDEICKTKSIKKVEKTRKKVIIHQQELSLSQNEIEWLKKQKKEIKIFHSSNPKKTLQTLIENYKDIQSLHIFSSKFCEQPQIVSAILEEMPFLKEITFNCNHNLSIEKISIMQPKKAERLYKIQLRWQLSKFFTEYFILHDFPIKKIELIQKDTPIQTEEKSYKYIPTNQSLLIQSDQHIKILASSSSNLQKVKILHFCTTIKNIPGKVKLLNDLKNLKNLHTLHLSGVTFTSIQDKFHLFIKENKDLSAIVLSQCIFSSSPNKILSSLRQLPHLRKLGIQARSNPIKMRPNIITALPALISLYLNNIIFEEQDSGIIPQQNSQVLKDFVKLKKLKYLSLYNCQPIFSDFFKYIHQETKDSLQLLSLGNTDIDNKCLDYLLNIKNLKLLNIDSCKIQGTAFCQYLKKYEMFEKKKLGLKMLSIANKRQRKNFQHHQGAFQTTDLMVMGSLLPQLRYINVYRRHELDSYNFKEFIKLKTLCVGYQLYKHLSKKREDLKMFVKKDH